MAGQEGGGPVAPGRPPAPAGRPDARDARSAHAGPAGDPAAVGGRPGARDARSAHAGPAGDPAASRPEDHWAGRGNRAPRPRLTSRAAVLAVVMCAIALSLAYPVREFIAQHRQIAQLEAQHAMEEAQVRSLQVQEQRLSDPAYIEQQARARLNMCMPDENCYVIIDGSTRSGAPHPRPAKRGAWYVTLWRSVQQADRAPAR